jgi:hypothetical protein
MVSVCRTAARVGEAVLGGMIDVGVVGHGRPSVNPGGGLFGQGFASWAGEIIARWFVGVWELGCGAQRVTAVAARARVVGGQCDFGR